MKLNLEHMTQFNEVDSHKNGHNQEREEHKKHQEKVLSRANFLSRDTQRRIFNFKTNAS
jgi:hypothetical protein